MEGLERGWGFGGMKEMFDLGHVWYCSLVMLLNFFNFKLIFFSIFRLF